LCELPTRTLFCVRWIDEPAISGLALVPEQIQLMIAEQTLREPLPDQRTHQFDDSRTVRTSITEVTNKYKTPALGVAPTFIVAQPP
jgi:hypothetical protein